jgi:hypothetical protein
MPDMSQHFFGLEGVLNFGFIGWKSSKCSFNYIGKFGRVSKAAASWTMFSDFRLLSESEFPEFRLLSESGSDFGTGSRCEHRFKSLFQFQMHE